LLGSRDSDVTESLADDEGELLYEKQNTFAEDLIDVLTVENDKSEKVTIEKVTIENSILSNIDDEFPTIDIISRLKSPVKSVAVAQDVADDEGELLFLFDTSSHKVFRKENHLFRRNAWTFMKFIPGLHTTWHMCVFPKVKTLNKMKSKILLRKI
jgi:hypothetical protein